MKERVDEIVWEFVGHAHKLYEAQVVDYYPELKLFIEYLINNYPAKDAE